MSQLYKDYKMLTSLEQIVKEADIDLTEAEKIIKYLDTKIKSKGQEIKLHENHNERMKDDLCQQIEAVLTDEYQTVSQIRNQLENGDELITNQILNRLYRLCSYDICISSIIKTDDGKRLTGFKLMTEEERENQDDQESLIMDSMGERYI